ncbi:MAG: type II toxin-antitoxin system HicA family toxin [Deltaproteobacteria bacterium]|nr:type II toxin-antitoxin system HicA family toxin [Deltaproteobacteria bacterium]
MSPRLPRITAKELIKLLKSHGFVWHSSKGSHQHFIGPGLLKAILKQAGLEWGE